MVNKKGQMFEFKEPTGTRLVKAKIKRAKKRKLELLTTDPESIY
jgi:hypothetical protein